MFGRIWLVAYFWLARAWIGCDSEKGFGIDIAVSNEVTDCLWVKAFRGLSKLMKSLSSYVGESKVKISVHEFGSREMKSCFQTLGIDMDLRSVDRVLNYYETDRECDETSVVTEKTMLEAFGTKSVTQLNTGRAWWNETYMSDDSLDALQYLANYQNAHGIQAANRISIVITPKLPSYASAPNNPRQGSPDGSSFIPSNRQEDDDCEERNHPDFRATSRDLIAARVLPVIVTTYNDPVMNGLDTYVGWSSMLRAMGYRAHSQVALVNPHGDLFDSRLERSVAALCSFTKGQPPNPKDTSATPSPAESGRRSSATSPTAIITYAITGLGGVGLIALAVLKIKEKISQASTAEPLTPERDDSSPITLNVSQIPVEEF